MRTIKYLTVAALLLGATGAKAQRVEGVRHDAAVLPENCIVGCSAATRDALLRAQHEERERLTRQRLEQQRLEQQRLEQQRLEQQRLEQQHQEQQHQPPKPTEKKQEHPSPPPVDISSVPEPSTYLLVATGLLGVAVTATKRRRRS
jgi:cell division protein FtsN